MFRQPNVEAERKKTGSINVHSYARILSKNDGKWIAWSLILIYLLLERPRQDHPAARVQGDPCIMIGKGARAYSRSHITQLSDPLPSAHIGQ